MTGHRGHILLLGLTIVFLTGSPTAAQIQPSSGITIFDDFHYEKAGYPREVDGTGLFGQAEWTDRDSTYQQQAWYYYNWRWANSGLSIHPKAAIDVNPDFPYSVRMSAGPGYTRLTSGSRNLVPVQMEAGFLATGGTWAVNVRLFDLETIRYFTQAFWLISPVSTSLDRSGVHSWVEFNHEWQNWFAVNFQSRSDTASVSMLTDDRWSSQNDWSVRTEFSGPVFEKESVPSLNRRTYLANGARVFELSSRSLATGETAGGAALRSPLSPTARPFSCTESRGGVARLIDDPIRCMDALMEDLDGQPDPWVQMMIQVDQKRIRYSALIPTGDSDFVLMQSELPQTRRLLPLRVTIGMHTPNSGVFLEPGENVDMELDWFYYSDDSNLEPDEVADQVADFREQQMTRVSLGGSNLEAPIWTPLRIEELHPPTLTDDAWLAVPSQRETNALHFRWNYRTRQKGDLYFGAWTGWENGHFRKEIVGTAWEVEIDVRVKDHNETAQTGPRWAQYPCTRFNYETRQASPCEGQKGVTTSPISEQHPGQAILKSIRPNPTSGIASLLLGIPANLNTMSVAVYDMLGREVSRTLDQPLTTGWHSVPVDWSDLASGTYVVRFETDQGVDVLKVTLAR